jgi:hypothetical protein
MKLHADRGMSGTIGGIDCQSKHLSQRPVMISAITAWVNPFGPCG